MEGFELGQTVIDTVTKEIVTIQCILNGANKVYVVSDDTDGCYMVLESRLTPYDKYYWD